MRPSVSPFIDRHLEATRLSKFEHNFITMTVTIIAAAYAIATVVRRYNFSPS